MTTTKNNIDKFIDGKEKKSYPSPEKLIPHGSEIRLVDELVYANDKIGVVKLSLDLKKPYFENGKFEYTWFIEIMAQGVACLGGYLESQKASFSADAVAYIIAIDRFRILNRLPLNEFDEIFIHVVFDFDLHPAAVYSATAFFEKQELARVQFKTYIDLRKDL